MELRQLEAFIAVAEERNFTRAAARLFVAQSGLSATIRSLEHDLGSELFQRTTRRVELTSAGLALLPEARRTLAAASAAVDAVNSVEGLQRGALDVGLMQASGLFDIGGLLAQFTSTYPGVRLRLRQASSADLDRLLTQGDLDVIFTTQLDEPADGLLFIPLLRSPLVLITAPVTGRAKRDAVDLTSAARRNVVGFPLGWGVRTLADRQMRAAGLDPRVDLEVNDTATLLDLVENGVGIAVVPDAIARMRPSLTIRPLADEALEWTISALTVAPAPINPAARVLWDVLAQRHPA